jgi:hypothetical protein
VTRECEIAVIVGPAMLARDHVLDMVGEGAIVLREETIFATIPGSGQDERSRRESIVTWGRKAACGP